MKEPTMENLEASLFEVKNALTGARDSLRRVQALRDRMEGESATPDMLSQIAGYEFTMLGLVDGYEEQLNYLLEMWVAARFLHGETA